MDQVYDKNPKNGVGITPLEIAFQLRHFAIYKLIVDNTTPLYRAVRRNHFEVCQVILESRQENNSKEIFDLLRIAAENQNFKIAKLLMDNLAKWQNRNEWSELKESRFEVCQGILENVKDGNSQENFKLLKIAAEHQNFKIAELLMENLAKLQKKDEWSEFTLD